MMKKMEMAMTEMKDMNAMKMNAMKMPIRAMYKKEMKTGDDDMSPMNNMKLNAMIKDPHKSKEENNKRLSYRAWHTRGYKEKF